MKSQVLPEGRAFSFICSKKDKEGMVGMERELFDRAQAACDTRAMADFLVENCDELLQAGGFSAEGPLDAWDVLLYEAHVALEAQEPARAARYAATCLRIGTATGRKVWLDALKCAGIAAYQQGSYDEAVRHLAKLKSLTEQDPEADIYHGNALVRLGRVREARPFYLDAMKLWDPDGVAARNFLRTLGGDIETGDAAADAALVKAPVLDGLEEVPPRTIPELSRSETFDIPIVINCRDRLGCLQQLVGWLLAAGYHQIFLIDNASTYPPLLSYYEEIIQDGRVTVIRLSRNFGHRAIWQARLLQQLNITTPYVYTDPDLLPIEDCPKGVVARLYQVLRRYPFLEKVGVGLKTDDITLNQQQTQEMQRREFLQVPVEEQLYVAACDTTFALYGPIRHYTLSPAMRTNGNLLFRHLPWYLDPQNLPEDEAYYVAHADSSSTFSKQVKNFS